MKIGIAQINTVPGDIPGNEEKIRKAYQKLSQQGAELVVFPEMALVGYWPGDLLLNEELIEKHNKSLQTLARGIGETPAIIGCIATNMKRPGLPLYNAAAWCENGVIQKTIFKTLLPNYGVFQERRHFEPGEGPGIITYKGKKIGITICEDIWTDKELSTASRYRTDPVEILSLAKPDIVVCLSASPWSPPHTAERLLAIRSTARRCEAAVVYCNLVGGNEELLFDGRSLALDKKGKLLGAAEAFKEDEIIIDTETKSPEKLPTSFMEAGVAEIKRALVFGISEYAKKTGFSKALVGLSGGIDSAVVATLATEALGKEALLGVIMPSAISSEHSREDALRLSKALGIEVIELPISSLYNTIEETLQKRFEGKNADVTEENLQARLRGILLMAISNKEQRLLLATSNKSEIAVGYATLYGDMCGGLSPIGDLYKTQVYELSYYLNKEKEIIPISTLQKAPSAELRPGQKDEDTLPPYDLLDKLLYHHIEENKGADWLIQKGFNAEAVEDILRRVRLNEYKRKQSAPILRVSTIAFGIGRRIPIIRK